MSDAEAHKQANREQDRQLQSTPEGRASWFSH